MNMAIAGMKTEQRTRLQGFVGIPNHLARGAIVTVMNVA
jgi:hypothetical protein